MLGFRGEEFRVQGFRLALLGLWAGASGVLW